MNEKVQRYQDLYNKFYIGYIDLVHLRSTLQIQNEYKDDQKVIIAVEKKHSDEIVLTYYIQVGRKNLYLYSFDEEEKLVREKKDPYGITVTEVFHITKQMDTSYLVDISNLHTIKKLLKERYEMEQQSNNN